MNNPLQGTACDAVIMDDVAPITVESLRRLKELLDAQPVERFCIPHRFHTSYLNDAASYAAEDALPKPKVKRMRTAKIKSLALSRQHKALMRSTSFRNLRIGIEYTTIPPSLMDGVRDHDTATSGIIEQINERGRSVLFEDVHEDPGVVEISSVILDKWTRVQRFYKEAVTKTAKFGCVPDSPHSIGGGGHIHISYKNWLEPDYYAGNIEEVEPLTQKVHNYCTRRPWIAWAFNDPSDNDTAVLGLRRRGNERAINPRSRTVEFRFFDAATSLNEQVEHVVFALRLFRLGLDMPEEDASDQGLRVPSITLVAALKGWRTTVQEFKLPYNLYRRYERNIRERYELGKAYLN